ncbi:hypothetical protein [Specibacter cremeus]|uniref:hypothetical protein n=1 Tax=Specibacter cremeus TaxID=1629051 RepID=UPI000F767012|nr:hypothetical protein [Specibacter cremeus]
MATAFQDAPRQEALTEAAENMRRSIEALGAAIESLQVPVSPQMARGVQATENAWRDMLGEFGFISAEEVGELLGSNAQAASGFAGDRRRSGTLIGIPRKNTFVYPMFQFDASRGIVRPAILKLLAVGKKYGIKPEWLAQWLCAPTGQLHGDRPVDHLDDVDRVVEAAEHHYGVQW